MGIESQAQSIEKNDSQEIIADKNKQVSADNKPLIIALTTISVVLFLAVIALSIALQRQMASNVVPMYQDPSTLPTSITPVPSNTIETTQSISPTPTISSQIQEEVTMNVYMLDEKKFQDSGSTDYLTAVKRTTGRTDIARFAIEQIIAGPIQDTEDGLRATFGEGKQIWFVSDSNCGTADFTVSIENRKATVKFCKDTMLAGDSSGFIVTDQISKTVNQFSSVDTTRVLTKSGTCLNDMSGMDADECWN